MNKPFLLPDLGEGVHEAEILTVAVSTGQEVQEGDLILEVETDKAAVEIPSPITGTVGTIHVEPGEMARVGDVLITFETAGGAVARGRSTRLCRAGERRRCPSHGRGRR